MEGEEEEEEGKEEVEEEEEEDVPEYDGNCSSSVSSPRDSLPSTQAPCPSSVEYC